MDVVEISLSRSQVALVDAADAYRVNQFKWNATDASHARTMYAQRTVRKADGSSTTQYLHTFLTGYPQTDHRNGDGLDNQRANLREATRSENQHNQRIRRNNRSGYKGVHWRRDRRKWAAWISISGKGKYLGCYSTAEEAARAYDAAARELHGEYACVNFPNPGERSARARGASRVQ